MNAWDEPKASSRELFAKANGALQTREAVKESALQ
jgi:hypothetical protein